MATLPADQLAPPGHRITPASPSIADALWLPVGHPRRRTLAELAPRTTQPSARHAAARPRHASRPPREKPVPNPHHDPTHRPPGDDDATVFPLPRQPQASAPPSSTTQERRWQVARIDTEPMTTQHYDHAITTLATLITQWKHNHGNANEAHEEAA
ncbi:MAG: hypothetical protein ACRDQ4_26250 [Pseudonocardiaceae bacterium]